MITIISISLALLVIVAGLLLLAKTKKDELGGIFTFASYAVITCGILLAAHAFVGCMINCHSNSRGGCGSSAYAKCHGSGSGGHGGYASYGKGHGAKCGSSKSCSKASCGKGGKSCSKSSCSSSSKSCRKKSKCCSGKKGKRKEIRKIIKTDGEDGEDIDVKVEIIE